MVISIDWRKKMLLNNLNPVLTDRNYSTLAIIEWGLGTKYKIYFEIPHLIITYSNIISQNMLIVKLLYQMNLINKLLVIENAIRHSFINYVF